MLEVLILDDVIFVATILPIVVNNILEFVAFKLSAWIVPDEIFELTRDVIVELGVSKFASVELVIFRFSTVASVAAILLAVMFVKREFVLDNKAPTVKFVNSEFNACKFSAVELV